MKPIVILRAGDPAEPVRAARGHFTDWIRRVVGGAWLHEWRVVDVRGDEAIPTPSEASAFVMTGSSSSVTERAPWMLRAEEHLREVIRTGTPYFGICFGHQMLARAMGGLVMKNARGREIGTVRVSLADPRDPITEGLPSEIDVNATHVDCVVRIPPDARVLASSALDPVQAFALGDNARCVQFHPEFDGDVMRRYVRARAPLIDAEGLDAGKIEARSKDAPHAESMLRTFVEKFVR